MIIGAALFILGLLVGSYLNSFLWRYHEKITYSGRSMCPCCHHKIAWYDNVPVLSWLCLSGKCRYCKKAISVQYPVVEILTAFGFLLVGVYSGPGRALSQGLEGISNYKFQITSQYLISNAVMLILLLIITAVMVMISVYDYKTKEIPNGFNLLFVVTCLLYLLASRLPLQTTLYYLLSSFAAFAFFYSMVYFSKETWMGGGDAKFAIGMGLLLGPLGTFLAILFGSVLGSIYGILFILLPGYWQNKFGSTIQNSKYKIRNTNHELPFGPFLSLGTFISVCFGPQIIEFYVKIVLGI